MKLFVFGLGYTDGRFVRSHAAAFESIAGTVRSDGNTARLANPELTLLRFDGADAGLADDKARAALAGRGFDALVLERLADADALLVSVQPGKADPVLRRFRDAIAGAPRLRTIIYLSTIGVYGDHGGAWIDETALTVADNPRQLARIAAERDWLALGDGAGKQAVVLRLAGIYGPGRNALDDLRAGEARRIDKPGQVFNRIHVADIGTAIRAALGYNGTQRIFNVTDDEPAPAPDVVSYAAGLIGVPPPPLVPFDEAEMSPMARSFYGANRRVSNAALRTRLGVELAYPTFRQGLDALRTEGEGGR